MTEPKTGPTDGPTTEPLTEPMPDPTDRPGTGRHPVNVGHLVMGLAFLGLVGVWALVQSDVVGGDDVRWLLPLPWVLAGLAGLLATTLGTRRSGVRRPREEETEPDVSLG